MVNENINKFIPESVKKPIATVSYFNEAEWNKDLSKEDLKWQEAINDSYQAEIDNQERGYGPCNGKETVEVYLDLENDYSFKQGGSNFSSCKIFGKVDIEGWIKQLDKGEIKINNKKSERDAESIRYEGYFKADLNLALSKFEENVKKRNGLSLGFYFTH